MAHPLHHAISSAKKFGGQWQDYIVLHSLMDSTKAHLADARHRLLQHNAWGIFLVEQRFGPTLTRASDGKTVAVRVLLERHVQEDFGRIPTLAECFAEVPFDLAHEDLDRTWVHAEVSAKQYGGRPEDYLPIHELLNSPRDVLNDSRYLIPLHNAWGIEVVASIFGHLAFRASDGGTYWPRQIAQDHIMVDMCYVPTLEESLKLVELQPWMYRNADRLSRQLEVDPADAAQLAQAMDVLATLVPATTAVEVPQTPMPEEAHA